MTTEIGLPPALDALKTTVRRLFETSAYHWSRNIWRTRPRRANRKTARPGASWKPSPACSEPCRPISGAVQQPFPADRYLHVIRSGRIRRRRNGRARTPGPRRRGPPEHRASATSPVPMFMIGACTPSRRGIPLPGHQRRPVLFLRTDRAPGRLRPRRHDADSRRARRRRLGSSTAQRCSSPALPPPISCWCRL